MRWPLSAVAILCLTGCAGQAPVTNPFMAPTTVPPPGTGAAGATAPNDPYYQQNPAASPTYGTPSYQPPGGYAPQGSGTHGSISLPEDKVVADTRRFRPATTDVEVTQSSAVERPLDLDGLSPAAAEAVGRRQAPAEPTEEIVQTAAIETEPEVPRVESAAYETVIRIVEPGTESEQDADDPAREPRRFVPAGEITAIDEATSDSELDREPTRTSKTQVAQVSHTVSSPASQGSANYGYDDSYTALSGRLEYSATRRRWKLRYIPHDASSSDEFGGSVELVDANGELEKYEPGQFVTVEGALTQAAGDRHDFAPQYEIRRVAQL